MILADTSVWVDHLRSTNSTLVELLARNMILIHPLVIGEIALGNLQDRQALLGELWALPKSPHIAEKEVFAAVETTQLFGRGIGWIDSVLLLSARSTPSKALWSLDRRFCDAARSLGLAVM